MQRDATTLSPAISLPDWTPVVLVGHVDFLTGEEDVMCPCTGELHFETCWVAREEEGLGLTSIAVCPRCGRRYGNLEGSRLMMDGR